MTEKELELLGFEKNYMDEDDDYYYYLDVVSGLGFISCTGFEGQNNGWYVEVFNTEPSIRFTDFGELQGMLNQLESKILKNK
jgi:hypothetical protein